MNIELLKRIGLTESQAKAYKELVRAGELTPPELARKNQESRTAAYMALSKLEEIGLAYKLDVSKKQRYAPKSPSELSRYIETKRREVQEVDEAYQANLSGMLDDYYASGRQPGLRYLQGKSVLREIYNDHITTGEDVYLIRTYADEDFLGEDLYTYLEMRAGHGITTDGLMPFDLRSYKFARKNDARLKRITTWYPREAYTAPVEIAVYGKKVSIISFGDEAIGMILESPQIAKALQEILAMAQVGARDIMKQKRRVHNADTT